MSFASFIGALNEQAEVSIDPNKPLKLYLRSAELVFKQAGIYLCENNLEMAYTLYLKYSKSRFEKQEQDRARQIEAERLRSKEIARRELEKNELLKNEELRRKRMLEIQRFESESLQKNEKKDSGNYGSVSANNSVSDEYERKSILHEKNEIIPVERKYYSENGSVLRPVGIPHVILSRFMQLAADNTARNLETCAVLAGKLSNNQFTITTLIVPKQTATSDTCAMVNEEEIVECQDRLDLMTLGWIHTHPSQQCFMSSVDLHTHFPFQLLMAEAIAIVVAPTQTPNFGVFRLTDPPGLSIVANCPGRGFHPHSMQQTIYQSLSGGPDGHAFFTDSPLQIVDLRRQ